MSTVGFVVHREREAAIRAADDLREALRTQGITCVDLADGAPDVALVVTVGGDGTFLRGAHAAAVVGAPVLGVKVGRLGFLTEVEPREAAAVIFDALDGRIPVEDRLAVIAEPVEGTVFAPEWGMNEVMVEKLARHRLIRLRVMVDGTYVTTFSADGVIVATPTGSTAYSFSARGPIVSPNVQALIVTPVAAHMVFDRSIVLAADQEVTVQVLGEEPGLLSVDGREARELSVGTAVRIRAAGERVRVVRGRGAPAFLARVREKFDLPGDPGER